MTTNQKSEELLLNAVTSWAEIFGRKLKPETAKWWLRLFGHDKPTLLARAIEIVTKNCERMPSPGHLTKELEVLKACLPSPPSTQYSYRKVVGRDSETGDMVDAIAYDHDPETLCFKATDCLEGREFLNFLAKWQGKQTPFPSVPKNQDLRAELNRQTEAWKNSVMS